MGLKVTKFPEEMGPQDLEVYLRGHAVVAGLQVTPFSAGLVRGYRHLLAEFKQDRYVLIMVTDYLLARPERIPWNPPTVDERLLSVGMIAASFHQLGGSARFWKYEYFSRFRESQDEHRYFKYWLSYCEDAKAARPGTSPFPFSETRWDDVVENAVIKLEIAVTEIKVRMGKRGSLEEWPLLPKENRDSNLVEFITKSNRLHGRMEHPCA